MKNQMKSVIYTKYGAPGVLSLESVPRPEPGPQQILIQVHASSICATDSIFRQGRVWSARLFTGLRQPKRTVLGSEFAGVVVAVGAGVTRFKPGDQVFGPTAEGFGAHSEYLVLPADAVLALKPERLSMAEAAVSASGALTALPFLTDEAQLQAGQQVLIIGASGSVGSYAVQLAKQIGARVTAVCSAANHDWVQALGADRVLDYRQTDFREAPERYDLIFDAVGQSDFGSARRALKPAGQYFSTVLNADILWQQLWSRYRGTQRARFVATGLRSPAQKQADLDQIQALLAQGLLQPVMDRCYPLADVQQAHAYVDQGHKKGNVALIMPVAAGQGCDSLPARQVARTQA
ncbi:MAG: NAD(P)-dependent alcohol dehydrogenase [Candidatus Sericytochromatia bacterium]|nr:NAD(P)-dependent alcohol dehydrogenase [Candidatus Sericytochromatia bacterium]